MSTIHSGTDAVERPTKVEVGQRWRLERHCEGHDAGEVVTVASVNGYVNGKWAPGLFDSCKCPGGHGLDTFLLRGQAEATYLGTVGESPH